MTNSVSNNSFQNKDIISHSTQKGTVKTTALRCLAALTLGAGITTAAYFIQALIAKGRKGLRIKTVASSHRSAEMASVRPMTMNCIELRTSSSGFVIVETSIESPGVGFMRFAETAHLRPTWCGASSEDGFQTPSSEAAQPNADA